MTIFIGNGRILGDVAYEAAHLEQLAAGLDRLGGGALPDPGVLAAMPVLDRWTSAMRPVPCLTGACTDHPWLRGPAGMTTEVCAARMGYYDAQ